MKIKTDESEGGRKEGRNERKKERRKRGRKGGREEGRKDCQVCHRPQETLIPVLRLAAE